MTTGGSRDRSSAHLAESVGMSQPRTVSDSDQDLLRIGELSARTDAPIRSLRYYEKLGLIEPALRTKAGFRRFPWQGYQGVARRPWV